MESGPGCDFPLFVPCSPSLNQRPSIRFGGTGERLESRRGIPQPLRWRGFSVFVVLSPSTVGPREADFLRWSGWTADVGIDLDARNGLHARVETRYDSGVRLLPGRPYLVGIVFRSTEVTLHVSGSVARRIDDVRVFDTGVEAPALLRIGGEPGRFRGELGDVVIYDRALSAVEIDALNAGMLAHYRLGAPVR